MKKSWIWFWVGILLAAGSLATSARARSNVVYAVEFNPGNDMSIYRVSNQTGHTTFVGEATGYANLILENGSQCMSEEVSIHSINGSSAQQVLISFDLTSFVDGGTNADGGIHQLSMTMVGAGGHFPVNFNFPGDNSSRFYRGVAPQQL